MYISKIDDIIDKTLDKFMNILILKSTQNILDFKKLIKEKDIIKYQKEIDSLLNFSKTLISEDEIKEITTINDNILLIKNLVTKYIYYYLFIIIGIKYNHDLELFTNGLIKFTKEELSQKNNLARLKVNKPEVTIVSNEIFNELSEKLSTSDTISNIIKITKLIIELKEYIKNNDSIDLDKYSNNLKEFIANYDKDKLNELLTKKTKKEDAEIMFDHKLIKEMIYYFLYKDSEKRDIFNILENAEIESGEFTYIDVVVPTNMFIDYNSIESVLSHSEINTNLPETIYDIINENTSEILNSTKQYFYNYDYKIQQLLNSHIIIPIVDDFLLYHKDNEKYEKNVKKENIKKDDTRLKYIINKINTLSEYYKNKDEIKKLFYLPLINRNAVLTNTYEDIKIISKMKNIIKINNDNIDLFNDLINFRLYPYISFKDFEKNGITFTSDTTVDSIRNVSINNINKKKFDTIQTRVIGENMLANIIGFAIINKEDNNQLNCINLNSFIDIGKETNEPLNVIKVLMVNKIKNKILSKEKNKDKLENNYYWLFDLENQKYNIPYYNISSSMSNNEIVKIIIAYLYDFLIESIINIIKEDIKHSHPQLITNYIDMVDKYKRIYPDMNNTQFNNNINEIEYLIYYLKSIKIEDTYDYNEDEFPGLYGNVHKLPVYIKPKNNNIKKLKLNLDFKENIINDKIKKIEKIENLDLNQEIYDYSSEYINAICQHSITWDRISEIKKINNVKFSTIIYEFIQQYVMITAEQDYICKSCKSSIDIKRFILDGVFDNQLQNFITYSIKHNINIEELPEYEKYKLSIRSIDKIIEKLTGIFNIQGLTGISYDIKGKRMNIVRDVIDLVLAHNVFLKKKYLSNRDNLIIKYGVDKNISNLFIFDLDNSIFIYSSKDKDFYKIIKYNNIIAYIIIFLIFEINENNIVSLNFDKICNYSLFKKINANLFQNINIIINKSKTLKPLLEYPILSYILYITSCFITKYNLWGDTLSIDNDDKKVVDKKKFNPRIQKSIINTVVEIFNSIMSVDIEEAKSQKIYLYEIIHTKFYFKQDFFKDEQIIKRLDELYFDNNIVKQQSINLHETNKYDITIDNKSELNSIFNVREYVYNTKFNNKKWVIPYDLTKYVTINKISNLSNCIDGEFHSFHIDNNNIICKKCKEPCDPNNLIKESYTSFDQRYTILYYRKLATKYCITGEVHQFEYDTNKNINICKKCKYIKDSFVKYSDKELINMYNIIEKNKKDNNLIFHKMVENLKLKNISQKEKIKKIFEKIQYKYEKYDNNIIKSVELLLDTIQKLLGTDILIENQVYNLNHNIYIIDHDYNGSKLETPLQIYENEKKFRLIENHPFFKCNVIVYTMQKNTKYELFYDMNEKNLLGYREINKEYIKIENSEFKLKINYSIKNILLQFGLPRQQININDIYPEIFGLNEDQIDFQFKKSKDFNITDFINTISNKRFDLIKSLGIKLNMYINRFKFNYNVKMLTPENNFYPTNVIDEVINTPLDILYNKYTKKIDSNISTDITDKNNIKHTFLKYINDIINYMPFTNIASKKDKIPFTNFIDYTYFIKNDISSNMILNYIIDEIIKLISYNTNKTIKTNIIHFVIDIITILFNTYNHEVSKFNKNINHFNQILFTTEFYLEVQNNNYTIDVLDYYTTQNDSENLDEIGEELQKEIDDKKYDDKEEAEALDVDGFMDAEGIYDLYTNYNINSINMIV